MLKAGEGATGRGGSNRRAGRLHLCSCATNACAGTLSTDACSGVTAPRIWTPGAVGMRDMAIGRAAGPLADRRGSRTLWAAGGRAWEGPDSCAAGRVRLVETKYDLSRTGAAVKGSRKRGTRRRRALTWTRASASRDASRWRGPRALRYAILEPQCKRLGPGRLGAALAPASLRVLLLGQLGSRRARPPGSGTALAERKPRQSHPGNPRSHGSLGTFLHTQSVKRGPLVKATWFFGVHA
jgi:hypothetical protein